MSLRFLNCRNQLQVALACTFTWAASCLLISEGYDGYDAAVMLYMGAPFVALAGVTLANTRAERLFRLPAASAMTVYDIELKARYLLHEFLWGHPTAKRGHIGSAGRDIEIGAVEAATTITADLLENPDETEESVAAARKLLSPEQLSAVEAVYQKGCIEFRSSALLHVFAGRFYHVFANNKVMP
jgi:hypothetical protein